jgi:hypothetical protein
MGNYGRGNYLQNHLTSSHIITQQVGCSTSTRLCCCGPHGYARGRSSSRGRWEGRKTIPPRDPRVAGTEAALQKSQNVVLELSRYIDWALINANADTDTGLSRNPQWGILEGETNRDEIHNRVTVGLSFEILEPLLPGNISRLIVTDRKFSIVRIATTVLHEFSVSCQTANRSGRCPNILECKSIEARPLSEDKYQLSRTYAP